MAMNMNAALNIRANVEGTNNIVALNRGLAAVEGTAKSVTGAMRGLAGVSAGLSGALGALAPLASVAGLVGLAKNALDAGDALNDMSQRTGVSVEALARFKKAAAVSGTDLEGVSKALVKLSKAMLDASTGGTQSQAAFKTLGISVADSQGKLKSADSVFLEIADRFKRMPDGVAKTALALKYFGKAGADMIPLLNMGGDAIDKLSVKMTTAFAQKADEYKDKLAILSGKVGALGADLLIALLPALNAITDAITTAVDAFNTLPGPIKGLAVLGATLAIAWGPITGIINGVAVGAKFLGEVVGGITGYVTLAGVSVEGLSVMLTDLGFALAAVPIAGWIAAAVAGLAALSVALYNNNKGFKQWADTSLNFIKVLATDGAGTMQKFGQWLSQQWSSLTQLAQKVGGAIAKAFSGPFGVIANVAKSVFGFVGQQIANLYNMLPEGVRKAIGGVGNYFKGAWNKAAGMAAAGGGGGNTQTGNMPGEFNPNLSAMTPGGKGSPEAENERKKLELDAARNSLEAQYVKDVRQINDLKRIENQFQNTGNTLKALEVQKSEAILEGKLAESKITDDTLLKLKESANDKDQANRKQRDTNIIQAAANKLADEEEKLRSKLLDVDQQITQERRRQAKEQRDALREIDNRNRYKKIEDLQGSEQAQRQRDIDALQQRIDDARAPGGAGKEEARRLEERLNRLKESYKEMDALANNAGYGFAKGIRGYLEGIGSLADSIANVTKNVFQGLEDKLVEFVTTGKASFKDFANEIIKQLIRIAIQQAIMKPLLTGLSSLFPSLNFLKPSANGNVFAANGIVPYAMGGVVDRPTVFPFARGVGLMGEAGPEAIIPLKRGADGKLGVAGGGGGGTVVNVSVDAKGSSVQGDNNQGAALGRVIAGAVQQELIRQRRPGGLLAA